MYNLILSKINKLNKDNKTASIILTNNNNYTTNIKNNNLPSEIKESENNDDTNTDYEKNEKKIINERNRNIWKRFKLWFLWL